MMRRQNYFSITRKMQHPLKQLKKAASIQVVPAGGSRGLVLKGGVDSASSLLPGETCVTQIEQLRKHFSGDEPSQSPSLPTSQPVVSQQLE